MAVESRLSAMAEEITPAGRTIAFTGAGGFIGAALCRRLAADGATVIAIDIDPAATERLPGIEFRRADTTDPADIAAALAGAELIAHTAAIVSEAGSMAEHVRVNVGGTANLLAADVDPDVLG